MKQKQRGFYGLINYTKVVGGEVGGSIEDIEHLHSCICNHTQVFNSFLKNDHIHIKDKITDEVIIFKVNYSNNYLRTTQ